jgi:hypothetical protein
MIAATPSREVLNRKPHQNSKFSTACSEKVGTGFPSGQAQSVCPEIMSNKKDQIMVRSIQSDHDPVSFSNPNFAKTGRFEGLPKFGYGTPSLLWMPQE